MILAALVACTSTPRSLDDQLSLADAQVVGTHNSYHIRPGPGDFGPFDYDHPPLDEQIDLGVRQFELDLFWIDGDWAVIHEPQFDPGTNCPTLVDCLTDLRAGSERNPDHLPIMVLLELKEPYQDDLAEGQLEALSAWIGRYLGLSHLVDPADVQGEAPTMREAMLQGWPPLRGQRGRFIPVVHEGGSWAAQARSQELAHVFYDAYGDLDADWAAVHTLNDPFDPRIPEVVEARHLVRTRADASTVEARANDTGPRDQAFASGAHFVSTDFPVPRPETGYVVRLEGGARCNPLTAPGFCTTKLLEPTGPQEDQPEPQ